MKKQQCFYIFIYNKDIFIELQGGLVQNAAFSHKPFLLISNFVIICHKK